MTLSYSDFEKVDIRSGTVVKVERFPEARKPAYKIWVDFGPSLGVKQTSAQVTVLYTPENLINRQVAGVVNFPVKKIAGFESEFLLLGFPDDSGAVSLIAPDPKVADGLRLL